MDIDTSIDNLPHTSSITIRRFKSLSINTYSDLLNYFPFRYEDYLLMSKINQIQPGEIVTVKGKVIDCQYQITKSGLKIQKVTISDNTGKLELVWFNQPYIYRLFKPNLFVSVAGEIQIFSNHIVMIPRTYDIATSNNFNNIHTGRLVPIYPEKKGLSSRTIREKIFNIIHKSDYSYDEFLPIKIITNNHLIDNQLAYKQIHFPENKELREQAKDRLAFNELFTIQIRTLINKKSQEEEKVTFQLELSDEYKQQLSMFIDNLPFKLTNSQYKVIDEIIKDLVQSKPMNRILQGDVGSGKTIVAAVISYINYLNGYNTLFMAPTEILAIQHFATIKNFFSNLNLNIVLITGNNKPNCKELENAHIVIGTHALINDKYKFQKIALIIIDEQHRFGVNQRILLKKKAINPHLLTMTATPIPRTVALTLYGDLDMSIINELPKGRLPIKTYVIPQKKRKDCYSWIKEKINREKCQIFVICPLIEESLVETMKSVKAAKKEYQILKEKIYDKYRVGLIHGKMKTEEKNTIMNMFKNDHLDILVATSLVEVGIDISNASIMIIEAAERFGLAQLHQLRGRIGRSNKQSYCYLFTENDNLNIIERLNFFCKNTNGLSLAEFDLKSRGPGNIFGFKQSGFINLKIASLLDFNLINKTRKAANEFINSFHLKDFSILKQKIKQYEFNQITKD